MMRLKFSETITDPALIDQGYVVRNGFVFEAINFPANVFNAIVIRNPSDACDESDIIRRNYGRFAEPVFRSPHSLKEHIDFINAYSIDSASIIADDISFLSQCPTLKHLSVIPSVQAGDGFDFSPLYELKEIKSLFCATKYGIDDKNSSSVDYGKIKGLQNLNISHENNFFIESNTLKTLRTFENTAKTLQDIVIGDSLDTLQIINSKIQTLTGIQKLPKLQCLYLDYNRSLRDISELEMARNTLTALRISKCSKITDFSVLPKLRNLEYLCLEGSQSVPDLSFIKSMPKLKTFIFDFVVDDGDLSPCLNLSYVYCSKHKRNYNVKAKDLPKGTYVWGNENIDVWRRLQ